MRLGRLGIRLDPRPVGTLPGRRFLPSKFGATRRELRRVGRAAFRRRIEERPPTQNLYLAEKVKFRFGEGSTRYAAFRPIAYCESNKLSIDTRNDRFFDAV